MIRQFGRRVSYHCGVYRSVSGELRRSTEAPGSRSKRMGALPHSLARGARMSFYNFTSDFTVAQLIQDISPCLCGNARTLLHYNPTECKSTIARSMTTSLHRSNQARKASSTMAGATPRTAVRSADNAFSYSTNIYRTLALSITKLRQAPLPLPLLCQALNETLQRLLRCLPLC